MVMTAQKESVAFVEITLFWISNWFMAWSLQVNLTSVEVLRSQWSQVWWVPEYNDSSVYFIRK